MTKQFLLASDFDQTLSFNDSGVVLSELIGFHGFHDKVKGLAEMNLVQQGAELSYLILHDPDFRKVRREHLVETGKQIRLKHDVALFARALENLADGYKFHFNVISAAPQEIIQSALEGIVPPDHIFGTRFRYNEATGEVDSIIRASAGWGKITVLEELRASLGISHDHIIYMGDGSSDIPVMMHVNQYDGLTIAVSEAKLITRVAKRTVLSDNAMSVLVPVLEKVLRWDSARIRRLFASYGLTLLEWDKMRTDRLRRSSTLTNLGPEGFSCRGAPIAWERLFFQLPCSAPVHDGILISVHLFDFWRRNLSKKSILMIVGDYVEDYEVMVPFQALSMVGHTVHAICPGKKSGEHVRTTISKAIRLTPKSAATISSSTPRLTKSSPKITTPSFFPVAALRNTSASSRASSNLSTISQELTNP